MKTVSLIATAALAASSPTFAESATTTAPQETQDLRQNGDSPTQPTSPATSTLLPSPATK